jgi:glycosyltransferase involved in cell wall biosynthesis
MWFPRALTPQARLHNALYLGRTYRLLLRGVDAVHVSNSHDAGLFPERLHWPSERVWHIPYPYAADAVPPQPDDTKLRVLFGGRLTEQKGIDVLVEVVRRTVSGPAAEEYEFTIAGSGDPDCEAALAAAATGSPNVRILGHVDRHEMNALYASADVAIVPSNWETFPFACLEPQGAGVPVVASDIPGCSDIVVDQGTGFLVPAGDAGAFCAALARLRAWQRDGAAELAQMRERAASRVATEFAPPKIMDRLEAMLTAVARNENSR